MFSVSKDEMIVCAWSIFWPISSDIGPEGACGECRGGTV